MNIFEQASRQDITFETQRGTIGTNDLWSLPLTSAKGLSLDKIAIAVNKELKASGEESFVEAVSKVNTVLMLKLDLVKHVIAVKKAEALTRKNRASIAAQKARIKEIMADKEQAALVNQTSEELAKQLAELELLEKDGFVAKVPETA